MKILFLLFLNFQNSTLTTGTFEFLGTQTTIELESHWFDLEISSKNIQATYSHLKTLSPQRYLAGSFQSLKSEFEMSDWMYYLFIQSAVNQLFESHSPLEKDLISYYLLEESGYHTRAAFQNNQLYIYVAIDQEIYEQTITIIDEVNFICLNRRDENFIPGLILHPLQGRKKFKFDLRWQSKWPARWYFQKIKFEFEDSLYHFSIKVDQNLAEIMKDHPLMDETLYIQKEFSPEIKHTIKDYFNPLIQLMSKEKAVKFLLAFTRSGFEYKEDSEAYLRNRPMFAEEVFVHRYSDCEDRTALFYQLNQLLFQLPIAVISFPDHLSVAISSEDIIPDVDYKLNLEGKFYYHTDPTGPLGWYKIGYLPGNLKGYIPEVLVSYLPQ